MKAQAIWIAGLLAASIAAGAWSADAAQQKEPQALSAKLSLERVLAPGENHVYTVTLQEGAAIVGHADQHGVDLVIDIVGPDGKTVKTVDSPNGTEGPEPFDLTAFRSGLYKLIIHTLDAKAQPGKYVIKVEQILSVDENGQRLAEKNYPPGLQPLWRSYLTDPKAIERFVANRGGKGPIVEIIPNDTTHVLVTYLYFGDEYTEAVRVSGGPHAGSGGILMSRFLRTPLFFASETVPTDARFRYGFSIIQSRFLGPGGSVKVSEDQNAIDSLNPDGFGGLSVLTMPAAPAQPFLSRDQSVPAGKLATKTIKSNSLKEDRRLTVYTPAGYDGTQHSDLLIVFDGDTYGGGTGDQVLVPTPTILDNLIAARKINPTIALLVPNMGKRNRDLTGYPPFADFIATELVPWARENYRVNPGPSHVVVAGSSFGGLCASYCGLMHPEAIGNVLSQSGSYWVTKDWEKHPPVPYPEETGDLISEFKKRDRAPIKVYLEIGHFDSAALMLATNRELRDVLVLKGYPVIYREFDSGHDYIWWRYSLAEGLMALIGIT